ncbi:DgyrCDS12183 [Dimorphilus gyrociliatus]|uniref:Alanine--glyoxylate aminotransferase n=1 Tax=Dimorphilus gyrociliatus TaxID=2664684 RepID=A0A7I8W5P7_9ANNE|nr:DgyrCDS12183 [Dimorphilus gyrociliatus]
MLKTVERYLVNKRVVTSLIRPGTATVRRCFGVAAMQMQNNKTTQPKKLFTPGPLGVSLSTKEAMLADFGSRDVAFVDTVKFIRKRLVEIAGVSHDEYTAVPLQGSGTYSLESVLTTIVPKKGKVLILENGAYGRRQAAICKVLNIEHRVESFGENEQVSPKRVEQILGHDTSFTTVSVVHCETSSGVLNPVIEIGEIVRKKAPHVQYFIDAMSSFGAIPFNMKEANCDYMVSSANKCIEGVPGFGYAICRTKHLKSCQGISRSLSLDLYEQYMGLEKNGQFRFTPPTHTMLAFRKALEELDAEGGVEGRANRYKANRKVLREGMAELGFEEYLDESLQDAYIITSFKYPTQKDFDFKTFYEKLSDKGQVIYPGKVLDADVFRIGNIGHLFPEDMEKLLECIKEVCNEMNVTLPLN